MLTMMAMVLLAAFFSVFLLGLNSKILRDDRIAAGAFVSWLITISQYAMTWAIIHSELTPLQYLLAAGVGGSTGITMSQYFYKWIQKGETK